eukprot:m.458535 g.458535  ORF g.458535 m.458535 type:complete len:67 (+) comp216871_c0_seq1:168-368(+)
MGVCNGLTALLVWVGRAPPAVLLLTQLETLGVVWTQSSTVSPQVPHCDGGERYGRTARAQSGVVPT